MSYSTNFNVDTSRHLTASVNINADTARRLPVAPTGVKSLSISLASKTISDTFSMETVSPLNLGDMVKGTLLGMPYQFLVEQTSQTGDLQRITGTYDRDELLNELITYSIGSSATASQHMAKIAGALGKSLAISIDDFTPSADLSAVGTTYKDLIGNLFGWTDVVAQRQINVFIRGGTIYALQRGKESGTVSIDSFARTTPTVTRRKLRTLRTSTRDTQVGSFTVAPMPFSGTISFGDASVTYQAGLIVSETHGGETTTWSYAGGYVSSKITYKADGGRIETEYAYGGFSGKVLSTETEINYDKNDAITTSRITRHYPLGGGFWGVSVEVDGETTATSISQGSASGKATIYSREQTSRALGGGYSSPSDGTVLPGESLVDTNFPVSGTAMLVELTAAIKWLNGKTEERVTLDIYGADAIDFTKTVTFGGNVYYLERNTLSKDPRTKKQSIEIVRWY